MLQAMPDGPERRHRQIALPSEGFETADLKAAKALLDQLA